MKGAYVFTKAVESVDDFNITLIGVGGGMGFAMQTRELLIVDKVRRDGIGSEY
jgi:hypothetical protein